jgi:hypothetical protein
MSQQIEMDISKEEYPTHDSDTPSEAPTEGEMEASMEVPQQPASPETPSLTTHQQVSSFEQTLDQTLPHSRQNLDDVGCLCFKIKNPFRFLKRLFGRRRSNSNKH